MPTAFHEITDRVNIMRVDPVDRAFIFGSKDADVIIVKMDTVPDPDEMKEDNHIVFSDNNYRVEYAKGIGYRVFRNDALSDKFKGAANAPDDLTDAGADSGIILQ